MDTLVIRYGLPGLPFVIVLFLSLRFGDRAANEILDIGLLLLLAVLMGHVLEQLWMLIFESKRFGLAYNSERRRVFGKLRVGIKGGKDLTADRLYAMWESYMYADSIDKELRDKCRRIWQFYHASAANAVGFLFGTCVCIGLAINHWESGKGFWFVVMAVLFFILAWLLSIKAKQSRHLVECIEEHLADQYVAPPGAPGPIPSSNSQ